MFFYIFKLLLPGATIISCFLDLILKKVKSFYFILFYFIILLFYIKKKRRVNIKTIPHHNKPCIYNLLFIYISFFLSNIVYSYFIIKKKKKKFTWGSRSLTTLLAFEASCVISAEYWTVKLLSIVERIGIPSLFTITMPSTPLWDCNLFMVSSTSDYFLFIFI